MTEKLYYSDPGMLEFDARITEASVRDDRCEVALDRTCFYPGGGGQPHDLGTIGASPVIEVGYRNDDIVHIVRPGLEPGPVHCVVDGTRRRDYMVQHTGQHIFSQALVRAGKLDTVSVHFGEIDTTIELKAETVEERILRAAEDIANAVIRENRRVILHEIDRGEASRFPLRRTPPDEGRLRIVEVDSFDWAACGGVHVASAGEVFLVKAVSQERIRGRVRVHIMIGQRAFDDYGRKATLAQELSRALTCGEESVLERVRDMQAAQREAARQLRGLRLAQAGVDADEALAGAQEIGGALLVRRLSDGNGPDYLKAFVERILAASGRIAVVMDRDGDAFQWIVAHSLAKGLDLAQIVPKHFGVADAKGGGRGARMQGVGARGDAREAFADAIVGELSRTLGKEKT